jgi:hypothetical protein
MILCLPQADTVMGLYPLMRRPSQGCDWRRVCDAPQP